MTNYNQEEKNHYNKRYVDTKYNSEGSNSILELVNAHAIEYFYDQVINIRNQNLSGIILDYGCGTGVKSVGLAGGGWQVHGIDISEKSIEAGNSTLGDNPDISLSIMNCEKTSFADNYFDIIFDYGTFSSIDIELAIKEISRILKPEGVLICIETLGHNPIANFNRRINMIRGKRTRWATNNIMTVELWQLLNTYFAKFDIKYFNLLTMLFIPLLVILPEKVSGHLLKPLWRLDQYLLQFPVFQKYAFKTVTVLKNKLSITS